MPIAKQKSIALTTSLRLQRPELDTDHNRVRQVLNNLLSNALKFTSEGEVTVTVTQRDLPDGRTETRFEVTDTGIGIPPETLDTIFEPFAQGDQSPTRAYSGTGLGLSICRKLVTLLGGSCEVSSQPGVGSTFWFYICCPARAGEAPFDKAANES
jgi:signal transduction histidine kinase